MTLFSMFCYYNFHSFLILPDILTNTAGYSHWHQSVRKREQEMWLGVLCGHNDFIKPKSNQLSHLIILYFVITQSFNWIISSHERQTLAHSLLLMRISTNQKPEGEVWEDAPKLWWGCIMVVKERQFLPPYCIQQRNMTVLSVSVS